MLVNNRTRKHLIQEVTNAKDGAYVTIKEKMPARSVRQNNFYWKILEVCEFGGNSKEDLNVEIKAALGLYREYKTKDRGTVIVPKSSRDLNVEQFNELIDAAMVLAHNLGVVIPMRGDYGL